MEEDFALLIPIFGVLGSFIVASMSIYFGYKADKQISDKIPKDDIIEWCSTKAKLKEARKRGAGFRWGGFLVGAGLGTGIGCAIVAADLITSTGFNKNAIAAFLVISLAMLLGGAGMIGAYFLERKLDRK